MRRQRHSLQSTAAGRGEEQPGKTSVWKNEFVLGTAGVWGLFLVYMLFAAPWIEGKSSAQIPNIRPDGFLLTNQVGRWMSLFPKGSWQRDESNRNIIQAKNSILIFNEYQVQTGGNIQVDRLTLLLFNKKKEEGTQRPSNDDELPLIIEAEDGAILALDKSGKGQFGEVKGIRFLGSSVFTKRHADQAKSFQIKTQNLNITPQKADTNDLVHFQLGDSIGTAKGLSIQFGNSQQTTTPPTKLSQVDQINQIRFQAIEHFQIRMEEKFPRTGYKDYSVACDGPAVFSQQDHRLDFEQNVILKDHSDLSELLCHDMTVYFTKPNPSVSEKTKTQLFPKSQKAQRILASGNPAVIRHQNGSSVLSAEIIDYDLQNQFVVMTSPKNIWVQLKTKESTLSVPKLTFKKFLTNQQTSNVNSQVATTIPAAKKPAIPGIITGLGGGTLVLNKPDPKSNPASDSKTIQKVIVRWNKQMSVKPDAENPLQTVLSIFGSASAEFGDEKSLRSDAIHLWTLPQPEKPGGEEKSLTDAFSGNQFDFLLAQGNVVLDTDSINAKVEEAQIFFTSPSGPQLSLTNPHSHPLPPGPSSITRDSNFHLANRNLKLNSIQPFPVFSATSNRQRHTVLKSPTTKNSDTRFLKKIRQAAYKLGVPDQKTYISGKKLTAKLENAKKESSQQQIEITYLDIQGNVVVKRDKSTGQSRYSEAKSNGSLEILANRIIGQKPVQNAAGSPSVAPQNLGGFPEQSKTPKLQWILYGTKGAPAKVSANGFQFLGNPIYFDQIENRIWTDKPGKMRFPIKQVGSTSLFPETGRNQNQIGRNSDGTKKITTGFGEVQWNGQLGFDGQTANFTGQVRCNVHSKNKDLHNQSLDTRADHLQIRFEFPVQFDQIAKNKPQVEQLILSALPENRITQTGNIGQRSKAIRLYQLETRPNGVPVSEHLLHCNKVHIKLLEKRVKIEGPGTLWMTKSASGSPPALVAGNNGGPLDFLKIQFQKEFDGFLETGKYIFNGPSTTLTGKLPGWKKKTEADLVNPLNLTCNWLSLHRWQPAGASQAVSEINAKGSVHVRGSEFDALASELRYNQQKDLFTVQGDARAAARFSQIDPHTGKKNRLVANLIKYSRSQQWFEFDGFKEGDITYFSTRRK